MEVIFNLKLDLHISDGQIITLLLIHVISCLLKRNQYVLAKINYRECDDGGYYKSSTVDSKVVQWLGFMLGDRQVPGLNPNHYPCCCC